MAQDMKSLEDLIQQSRDLMKESLSALKRIPWAEAIREAKKSEGCYLIYDASGLLLYVGSSKSVRTRLSAHLSPTTEGLVRHIAQSRGFVFHAPRHHACACGKKIKCGMGEVKDESYLKDMAKIADEVRSSYFVAMIPNGRGFAPRYQSIETIATLILNPKYKSPLLRREWEILPEVPKDVDGAGLA